MKKFLSIFFIFFSIISFSQNYPLKKEFNSEYNLNSYLIYNIIEDNNNFWIATDNGVIKYNGNFLKLFSKKDRLPTNDIFGLNMDSKGRIWLNGYYSGLFYIKDDKVYKINKAEKLSSVEFIFETNNKLFFKSKSNTRIYSLDHKNNFKEEKKLEHKNIVLIDFLDKSKYFIGYNRINHKKYIIDRNLDIISEISEDMVYIPFFYDGINPKFSFQKNQFVYHHTDKELHGSINLFNLSKSKMESFLKFKNDVVTLSRPNDKEYTIILKNDSIVVYKKGVIETTLSDKLSKLPLDKTSIYYIFIDSNQNIWIIDKSLRLQFFPENFFEIEKITNQFVFEKTAIVVKKSILVDNTFYFITNNDIFFSYDINSKEIKKIKEFKNLNYNKLYTFKNKIFLSFSENILTYEKKNNRLILIDSLNVKYSRISSNLGLNLFYTFNNKLFNSKHELIYEFKTDLRLNNLKIDNKSRFIVSNEKEISILNLKTNKIRTRKISNTNKIALFNNYILAGTNSDGLVIFNNELKFVNVFFKNQNISDIYIDKVFNQIVITSNLGIYFIKYKNGNFKTKMFIPFNDFIEGRVNSISSDSNFFYVTTQNELISIKRTYLDRKIEGEIDLNFIRINDEITKYVKIGETIKLKRNENNITISTSIKAFQNESNFLKYYCISKENEVEKWNLFTEREIAFKQLKPGDYILKFKAISKKNDSKISPFVYTLKFKIEPYFWETIWFYVLCFIGLIIIILCGFKYYSYKQMKKNFLLLQLSNLELKALKAQMNPHFLFNALNNIQSSIFLEGIEKANLIFIKFSNLLRSTLDIVNKDAITLFDELNYIKSYLELEQLRLKNTLEVNYIIDDEINLSKVKIPVMLIQPIIENALLHGLSPKVKDKKIVFEINKINQDSILITIQDNGVGRDFYKNKPDKEKRKSYATKIITERLKILRTLHKLHYDLEILDLYENENPTGTKVLLTIPLIS